MAPVMHEIARCESRMHQFDKDGSVKIGEITPDRGLFQVAPLWVPELKKAGIDPDTLEGNVQAARYIYNRQGLAAWSSSEHCWGEEYPQLVADLATK